MLLQMVVWRQTYVITIMCGDNYDDDVIAVDRFYIALHYALEQIHYFTIMSTF